MIYIDDNSGSNIDVQLIDLSKVDLKNSPFANSGYKGDDVLMVLITLLVNKLMKLWMSY